MQRSARGRASSTRAVVGLALAVALWAMAGPPVSGAAERAATEQQDAAPAQAEPGHEAPQAPGEEVVVVAEGDTLWGLALPHAPPGSDPHGWVAEVAQRNGIEAGSLRPGDVVRIPVE